MKELLTNAEFSDLVFAVFLLAFFGFAGLGGLILIVLAMFLGCAG